MKTPITRNQLSLIFAYFADATMDVLRAHDNVRSTVVAIHAHTSNPDTLYVLPYTIDSINNIRSIMTSAAEASKGDPLVALMHVTPVNTLLDGMDKPVESLFFGMIDDTGATVHKMLAARTTDTFMSGDEIAFPGRKVNVWTYNKDEGLVDQLLSTYTSEYAVAKSIASIK